MKSCLIPSGEIGLLGKVRFLQLWVGLLSEIKDEMVDDIQLVKCSNQEANLTIIDFLASKMLKSGDKLCLLLKEEIYFSNIFQFMRICFLHFFQTRQHNFFHNVSDFKNMVQFWYFDLLCGHRWEFKERNSQIFPLVEFCLHICQK